MTEHASLPDPAGEDFLLHRPRLLGLAYRMLGDMDEAEDVVQDAYLRWHQADREAVRSPEAWLVTVVTRLAVDRLRRLATERAAYPGPWLPEPIATAEAPVVPSGLPTPDYRAELTSDLSIALLVLLERLAPEERAAFVLREVFGTDYAEIAQILERSTDAIRQMVHRARTRVHAERRRVAIPPDEHERMLERFLTALAADDAPALVALLAPDVVLATDGGGQARAARQWLAGPDRVSRFLFGVMRKFGHPGTPRFVWLNGQPALLTIGDDGVVTASTMLDVDEGRIRRIFIVRNPGKLRRVLEPVAPVE